MREIYTSPRQQNIDNVIALMAEHGIETTVSNRSNYNRPTWQRFSYTQQRDDRSGWPQVWITRADDYARARVLLREIGIEPQIRHAEELAAARDPALRQTRRSTPNRVRRILLIAVVAVFAMQALRYMHII
jgi:hypothetical protein